MCFAAVRLFMQTVDDRFWPGTAVQFTATVDPKQAFKRF
jgi:hypothetical protein